MSAQDDARGKAIDKVARDFRDAAHQRGNSSYTFDQAKQRVSEAARKGDLKRENGNR